MSTEEEEGEANQLPPPPSSTPLSPPPAPPLIKQIDGRSVHHIQSGQVINDGLNSAVKELVENALDAHASSVEVRFKNYGLEIIEVIDNGDGILPENYDSVALKHYTSKLTSYSDLESVTTFGFRGEALSSLCALSDLQIITATASEAPKGTKLEFANSGALKSRSVIAASKGTTVSIGSLFKSLPVRRRELERNIKREYTKVLNILQAYASVCVGVKFSVFNQPAKGKRSPVFSTKGNPTTRENISNVFGSKTLAALLPLDLEFEMKATTAFCKPSSSNRPLTENRKVKIVGHISRPVVGEGRNAPDRQMFFVNGRPCVLPQISKAFNEVYKGFNVTQSPFVFADLKLDTNAYDVNVSPDKRTILLHDQPDLLENLKLVLTELFEKHEQTVPISHISGFRQTALENIVLSSPTMSLHSPLRGRWAQLTKADGHKDDDDTTEHSNPDSGNCQESATTTAHSVSRAKEPAKYDLSSGPSKFTKNASLQFKPPSRVESGGAALNLKRSKFSTTTTAEIQFANSHDAGGLQEYNGNNDDDLANFKEPPSSPIPSTQPPVNPRPPPIRSQRRAQAIATITIGDRSPISIGTDPVETLPRKKRRLEIDSVTDLARPSGLASSLNKFLAPGSQAILQDGENDSDVDVVDSSSEQELDAYALEIDRRIELSRESPNSQRNTKLRISPDFDDVEMNQGVSKDIPKDSVNSVSIEGENHEDFRQEDTLEEEGSDKEFVSEEQAREKVSRRAARRLKEAQESTVSHPIDELLQRNIRKLNNARKLATISLVRLERASTEGIKVAAQNLRKTYLHNSLPSQAVKECENFLSSQQEAAEQRLSLTVTKDDFLKMKIHGQFNKGFILASRRSELFIIDQHASDEKYNFETLQSTTVVQNQPLVIPKTLDLMAMDEIAVADNLDVLKRNGFVVEVDPEMPTGRRCKLISLPMSRETVFGVGDLEELIHLIHQSHGSGTTHIRCSKVRSMFAMRACRKSVMVGKSLPEKAMEKIVKHMAELDKPWNCPHGRPTMRHLVELGFIERWVREDEEVGLSGLDYAGYKWKDVLDLCNNLQSVTGGRGSGDDDKEGGGESETEGMQKGRDQSMEL